MRSIPTIVTATLSGVLADRLGAKNLLIPLISALTLGMAIQTAAVHFGSYNFLLVGRFVFSIGCEPINIVKGIIINDWFMGSELSTALNVNLSFVRGVVCLCGTLTPWIYERTSITVAFMSGLAVCGISFLATLQLRWYQGKIEEDLKEDSRVKEVSKENKKERDILTELKGIREFPLSFWLLTCSVLSQYAATQNLFYFVTSMLNIKFGIDSITAGSLFGLIYLTCAVLLPFIGGYCDKYGGISLFMVMSALIGAASNILWLLIPYEECVQEGTCV